MSIYETNSAIKEMTILPFETPAQTPLFDEAKSPGTAG
jgi:hypothetical protein